jgi:hypothetical protein
MSDAGGLTYDEPKFTSPTASTWARAMPAIPVRRTAVRSPSRAYVAASDPGSPTWDENSCACHSVPHVGASVCLREVLAMPT